MVGVGEVLADRSGGAERAFGSYDDARDLGVDPLTQLGADVLYELGAEALHDL